MSGLFWDDAEGESEDAVEKALQHVRSEGQRKRSIRRNAQISGAGTFAVLALVGVLALGSVGGKGGQSQIASPAPTAPGPSSSTPFKPVLAAQVVEKGAQAVKGSNELSVKGEWAVLCTKTSCDGDPGRWPFEYKLRSDGVSYSRDNIEEDGQSSGYQETLQSSPTDSRTVTHHANGTVDWTYANGVEPSSSTAQWVEGADINLLFDRIRNDTTTKVVEKQVDGKDAYVFQFARPSSVTDKRNVVTEYIFDANTYLPMRIHDLVNGEETYYVKYDVIDFRPKFSDKDFVLDTPKTSPVDPQQSTFKVVADIGAVRAQAHYRPVVAGFLPDGFQLQSVAFSAADPRFKFLIEDSPVAFQDVAVFTYRRGVQTVQVTNRLHTPGNWTDPYSPGASTKYQDFVVQGGAYNGMTAHMTEGDTSSTAWLEGKTVITTVQGDLTKLDLQQVLNGLQQP